jgi:eukaryotic-like serine/threonine-protein kinase
LKILDFGVARRLIRDVWLPDAAPTASPVIGTVQYMAPEVLRGLGGDARSDIFSAGAVLYELATAWRAFPQRSLPELKEAINNRPIIVPSLVNPLVPPALDRIVIKALQKASPDRYRTATELAEAIEAVPMKQPRTSRPVDSVGARRPSHVPDDGGTELLTAALLR